MYCPGSNSQQLPKSKWALIFSCDSDLHAFIQEVDQSEEKQNRLSIDEYSVFGNVMFAFMHRQYKMTVWVSHIRDLIQNQPKAILIFNERFKQLSELVEKGVGVNYFIDWRFEMVPRKYEKKNNTDENVVYFSDSSAQQKKQRISMKNSDNRQGSDDDNDCVELGNRKQLKHSPPDQRNQTSKGAEMIQSYLNQSKRYQYDSQCNANGEIFDVLRDFSIKMLEKINQLNEFFSGFVGVLSQIQAQNQEANQTQEFDSQNQGTDTQKSNRYDE